MTRSGHTITGDKAVAGLTSQGPKFESRALGETLDPDPYDSENLNILAVEDVSWKIIFTKAMIPLLRLC